VNITDRDRNTTSRNTGARSLNGPGIGSANQQDFTLIWNFIFFSHTDHPLYDARVRNGANILYLDAGTLAKRHLHFEGIGRIARRRDIERNAHIRIDGIRRRGRAARANLLLCGEDKIDIMRPGLREGAQGLDRNENADAVIGRLAQLKASGVSLSIDDFGAGHTSFRNLRKLGVDIVKIDGAFMPNIVKSNDDRAFVHSLVDLSRRLQLKTVAEWVQDEESAALLAGWGCDYLQGALIGLATSERPWRGEKERAASA